jgi:predicted neuraminidase
MSFLLLYLFLEKSNQTSFNKVIFNIEKIDINTPTVLEVRHPLYNLILQGFILLRVVIIIIDIFW